MRTTSVIISVAACTAATLLMQSVPAQSPPTIDGPITIDAVGTAGGGIDPFGRLVGRQLGRRIPGHRSVTVEPMPGAGGVRAANFLARQTPRDGTATATFAGGPVLEPLIGARNPPQSGEGVQKLVAGVYATPQPVFDRANRFFVTQ